MSNLTLTPYLNDITRNWVGITSSIDGGVLASCVYGGTYGYIYTSTNSGVNWSPRMTDLSRNWNCIACSSNGSKIVAAVYNEKMYTSIDYGATWRNNNNIGIRINNFIPTLNTSSSTTLSNQTYSAQNGTYDVSSNIISGIGTSFNNYQAFAYSSTNKNYWAISINNIGATVVDSININGNWLQIRLPTAVQLTSFTTYAVYNSAKSVVIAGSNDGLIWNNITTINDLGLPNTGVGSGWVDITTQFATFQTNTNTNYYSYIRIIVTNVNTGVSYNSQVCLGKVNFSCIVRGSTGNWNSIASSSDGINLVACTTTTIIPTSITPTSIANLQLWLDAKDYSTLTFTSGNVTKWNDKSGFNYDANNYNGSVTYNSIGFNNLPAVQLTASSFRAESPSGTSGITFFVVFQKNGNNDTNNNEALITKTNGGNPSSFDMYSNKRLVSNGVGFINLTNPNSSIDIMNQRSLTLYSSTINNTQWCEYLNGGTNTFTNNYSTILTDSSYIYIGTRGDKYTTFTGVISEVIVYNRVLTTVERQNVEGYLARKWNLIILLPTNHPYYNTATDGYIYTSADSGANWTPRMTDITRNWSSVVSSSNGVKLAACAINNNIYTSTNSGTSWTPTTLDSKAWSCIASSSDGTKLVAGVKNGYLYTSIDSGANWTSRMIDLSRNWCSVTSSSDGKNLFASVQNGQLYTSSNYGENWIANDSSRNWSSVALSNNGRTLISCVYDGYLYISRINNSYYNTNTKDLSSYYIRTQDIYCIQPISSQSLTLNSGGFKTNTTLIDKAFSLYKYGERKNSFFKENNVDIGSLFQVTDVSYVYVTSDNYITPPWNTISNTFINAKWIWSSKYSILSAFSNNDGYFYWFYYTFYYTNDDVSGNIYGICDNAAKIYFNNILIANTGYWGATETLSSPSSITIKKGLNYIRIPAYNDGTSYSSGLFSYVYNNYYFNDSLVDFQTKPSLNMNITNFSSASYAINNVNSYTISDNSTYMWYGSFKSPYSYTTNITFGLNTDDASYLWFGDNAINGRYTIDNANIKNGSIHGAIDKQCVINVVNDIYYPIRIIYGQNVGGATFQFYYINPSDTTNTPIYDLSGIVFYPGNPAGLIVSVYDNSSNCIANTNEYWTYSRGNSTYNDSSSNYFDMNGALPFFETAT
jgi:photosystem II stability/assembly factor-like uncharacterized protein